MAKKAPFKKTFTVSMQRNRADALANGRQGKAAYTSGAREVNYAGNMEQTKAANRKAWEDKAKISTYTSSARGRMSTNGRTAGGSTWTFTKKDSDGNTEKQSGRNKLASRRQRYYDVRVGLGLAGG